MLSKIGEDFGRLFEVGFNIGILAAIEEKQIQHEFDNFYVRDLQSLNFKKIFNKIANEVGSDPQKRKVVENWCTFFLQKGFLSGLNFFQEYLKSAGWNEKRKLKRLKILYYQCSFSGQNSIGTYEKDDDDRKEILSQFKQLNNIQRYLDRYKGKEGKGEFVNADTLMLLQYRDELRILCVDLSIFSIKTPEEIKDLDYIEIIRRSLLRDIKHLKSKSVFSQLRIDTESLDLEFSEDLKNYFTAFKYKDKETAKLIQAAGYAYSFYQFLRETNILKDEERVTFNAVGYSDRDISAMSVNSLNKDNLEVLHSCYQIYKYDSSEKEIFAARKQVLSKIKRSAYRSFDDGKRFVNSLLNISENTTNFVPHKERVEGFANTAGEMEAEKIQQLGLNEVTTLRNAHAKLIEKALDSEANYIFLTGNPGIGKTTAIANFLKKHIQEGFLFFYVSPRTQVNLDIIDKFKDKNDPDLLCDNRILAINTNSDLIRDNSREYEYVVRYVGNEGQGDFNEGSVRFLDSRQTEREVWRSQQLDRPTEDVIQERKTNTKGVLNSICQAIYTVIDRQLSNNIIATASIQSLKKTDAGDTLKHFEKIFKNAYNEKEGLVIDEEMKAISKKIKYLFIMVDEITGDDGGVEFLNRIGDILFNKYGLNKPDYGFKTKIIVADASIVDKDVIKQHLETTSPEPNKIYFRRSSSNGEPLSKEDFSFKNLPATLINANSYPAKSLSIAYKVFIESCKFVEEDNFLPKDDLVKKIQREILQDIESLLNRSDVNQIIVYIQDKQRLSELIDKIKATREFEKSKHYLEIHANISDVEKELIQEHKENVKVIFMTASGSRGLSFPKTKHILVEVPRFEIERNLMEIIQTIYRGRGNEKFDNQDKELIFYLGDRAVYYDDDPELSLQESSLGVLNILLLLKASIMTRISGFGKIGSDKFLIIPIGGKSVLAAGETFSSKMQNLIKMLKSKQRENRRDSRLKYVYESLQELMSKADFNLRKEAEDSEDVKTSYLSLQKDFNSQFSQIVKNGLDGLLKLGNMEVGYISGGLLAVPISDRVLEETYKMSLVKIDTYANGKLWKNMEEIRDNNCYPPNLRSAIRDAIELVNKLRSDRTQTTQKFQQNSQKFDRYYALPLLAFIAGEKMAEYFKEEQPEPESKRFRDILETYIRSLYPVGGVLPIGHQYETFPFIIFRSYNLEEMREKIYTDKYLLSSNELNVLNLILSKEDK